MHRTARRSNTIGDDSVVESDIIGDGAVNDAVVRQAGTNDLSKMSVKCSG